MHFIVNNIKHKKILLYKHRSGINEMLKALHNHIYITFLYMLLTCQEAIYNYSFIYSDIYIFI